MQNYYELLKTNNEVATRSIKEVDESAHLWTIQDVKGGDVLASNHSVFIFSQEYMAGKPEAHCGIMNGLFIVKPEGCWTNEKCYPATKEQRNLLFSKMKEAGYEWDAEKKELKKIEQKPAEWSEEDKEMIDNIIDYMAPMPIFFESTKGESGKEYTQEFIIEATKWLKSLKDKYTWKPNKEQITALRWVLNNVPYNKHKEEISRLLDQIKDL